ncbi:MAG: dihydrodipicolinate synthase family protein [Alphaproteobacteria bacterium]|nr:dihydrodipicolinate synthase family protein [Alphaproteobacteria bacterium]
MVGARPSLGGVHAVLYALFDARAALDSGAMRAQTQFVVESGVRGVSVLGLATEADKLASEERRDIVARVAAEVGGRLPYSVAAGGDTVKEQREAARFAADHGADLIILRPPAVEFCGEGGVLDFLLRVADGFDCRFAVQNAPRYLGRSLSRGDLLRLRRANPNFDVVKSETDALEIAALAGEAGDAIDVLGGRGGLEMTDSLRAGARGFVIAPDVADYAQRVCDVFGAGDYDEAERIYGLLLPVIVFVMQSVEHLVCYGKRVFGLRSGISVYDRAPALAPTEFGLFLVEQKALALAEIGK